MADLAQQNTAIKPEQIIDIIIRYKWLIILPLCISITIGIVYTVFAKKTYEASTTILIQPQRVPMQYVQSIVSTDLGQRLSTISQQILSSSNLEKIIEQFGLFDKNKNMYLEDKITNLRERVDVKIEYSEKRGSDTDVFYVSFKGEHPDTVRRVANTLASYFMDENLKVREAQAVGTSEFLEAELQKIKLRLEEKEKILSEYRSKHIGGLPDELESNLRTLDRLQLQLSDRQNALGQLENSINIINSQISRTKQIQEESVLGNFQLDDSGKVIVPISEVEQLYEIEKMKLDELLSKYTEKHPDIVRLTKSVKTLKEKVEKEKEENETLAQVDNQEKNPNLAQRNNLVTIAKADDFLFEQQLLINKINNDIKKHESDIIQIQKTMVIYQQRVADTPKREQELQSLNRDYNNIMGSYSSLLSRKLESEIAVNMEKKQKGEQFRILDHARLPQRPISPDVKMLFVLSLVIGLGLGGGIVFLIEFLNTSIKNPEQIESEFDLPLLASIPSLKKPGPSFKKKIDIMLFSLFALYTISVCSLFAVMNYQGIDKTIGFIKTQLNI
ncbi:MAG: Wzz/FepE/Etk N-terminal domain-containing protein [Desulfobacula sp.]|jgi:polysaccharide chain length determinant protein (PEP-CTERM system associated)|nr:Wzz/FepE/Etk N-terminal domain-containing protein [Desulfobacula sp.]